MKKNTSTTRTKITTRHIFLGKQKKNEKNPEKKHRQDRNTKKVNIKSAP